MFTKPFKTGMSLDRPLDRARGRDFLVLTKRSAASGDENVGLMDRVDFRIVATAHVRDCETVSQRRIIWYMAQFCPLNNAIKRATDCN